MTQPSPIHAGVSLRELLSDAAVGAPACDVRTGSCTSDWRQVRPGDTFVAVTDDDSDGHDHATTAAARGAAAIVCERPLPIFKVPQFVVSDSRIAYGRLCQALVGFPSRQLKLIGIAGTHGKTTVARLLTAIFRQAGIAAGTFDSLGYWDGWEDRPTLDAPLSPPTLARSLAEMSAAGATHAVLEVSSRELSRAVLAGVTLDVVCLTQVGRGRMDWHGSLHNYRRAVRRIFDHLPDHGLAALNADDPVCVDVLCSLNQPALTFGLRKPAEITADVVEQQINEQTLIVSAGDESVGVRTEMIGEHHAYNCLAAATIALAYGIELTTVARGLEAVDRLPGRLERVMCGQDFAVLVDAADTSESLRQALRAARQVTSGRVICVFGATGDQERDGRPAMGRVVGAMADVAVVTSNHAGDEDPRMICLELRSGFAGASRPQIVVDRTAAIAHALELARAGDTVLIAGMGERGHRPAEDHDAPPLNDADIVRQLLRGNLVAASRHRLAA